MNEVVKIVKTEIGAEEVNSVNARELWVALEIKKDFSDWIKAQIDSLGLIEGEDYIRAAKDRNGNLHFLGEVKISLSGKEIIYIVTIDAAKHIAMASRTEKGRMVRNYFIKVEKRSKQPLTFEEMAKQTIMLAEKRIAELENKIEEHKPLVSFAKSVEASVNSVLIRDWAKAISKERGVVIGQNKAFEWLRNNEYLMKNNQPYQRYIDNGYFECTAQTISTTKGTREVFTTRITGKGQVALADKIVRDFSKRGTV